MSPSIINVLVTSFAGLGLPRTLCLPIASTTPIELLITQIRQRLPTSSKRYIITTTANQDIALSPADVGSLLPASDDFILPLRVSLPLCGGKGGFGSQLRAAGGRMSSKRKKSQGDVNNSNRNLDGRRLRTVNEAKALAEYLAVKPDMEKKERETRRKRWEHVVDTAERRGQELRANSKGKVDAGWVEDKEEAEEKTREAVLASMNSNDYRDNLGRASKQTRVDEKPLLIDHEASPHRTTPLTNSACDKDFIRCFTDFDEDEEYLSISEAESRISDL